MFIKCDQYGTEIILGRRDFGASAGTSFCGCVTKSQARAQAQAAYLAGQNDALAKMAGQGQGRALSSSVRWNTPMFRGLKD